MTRQVDAEIEALLRQVAKVERPPIWQGSADAARRAPLLMNLLFRESPPLRFEEFTIASSGGFELPVRLYRPEGTPKGLIVYFHGGGWVIGSVAAFHPLTATLAQRTGCAVLSVDYRLAPEHAYPVPLNDARAALGWAARCGARAIGVEPRVLVVMGDSAGGNLATIAARMHNQSPSERRVDLQVLVYPVCDHDFDTGSYHEYTEGHLLTRKDMKWFWDQYCPDICRRDDPNVSPLRGRDFSGSPAALILTAGCDPLRDEGEAYGTRLEQFGVTANTVRCDGLVHGFLAMIHQAASAARAFDRIVDRIGQATVG